MFLIGVLLQRHYGQLAHLVEGKAMAWLAVYLGVCTAARLVLGTATNGNPLFDGASALAAAGAAVLMALFVVSFAYSHRGMSERLLRGNDISYGVYVYHMLVVNAFVELGWTGHRAALGAAAGLTMLLALASWRFVERPSLRLKAGGPWLAAISHFKSVSPLRAHAATPSTLPLRSH
jgi:peptidoglycan/LPS O-acetylase OafA/YrhL